MQVQVGKVTIRVGNRKKDDEGTYVGRPTALGNPFPVPGLGRDKAVKKYEEWLRGKIAEKDLTVCGALERLRQAAVRDGDLVLVCWCAPLKCHGDVIASTLAEYIAAGRSFVGGGINGGRGEDRAAGGTTGGNRGSKTGGGGAS